MKTRITIICIVTLSLVLIPQVLAIGAPPLERVPASVLRVIDLNGNTIELINIGEQIQIQADLANAQDTAQSLVYIVEIYDNNEIQVFRGWIEATLEPMNSFSPAVSWIPEKPGRYTSRMMVWEALDNPSSLSPALDTEFYVVGNMDALNENRYCSEGKELVFKINYNKVACVFPETLVKLLGRGWANWHDWYSPLFIENLRQGPQDLDTVHAEFVKREVMKDFDVSKHFLHPKNFDYSCCIYQQDPEFPQHYQLVINFSDISDTKQLKVVYDLRQQKVIDATLTDIVQSGGASLPVEPESKVSPDTNSEPVTPPLQIKVVGENQVRRGTTQSIEIQVVRGSSPIEGARVFIDIEDYGEDIIKEFDGYTNSEGYFVFSWEIPQSFDDVETLLAFIDVTDGISSKTELFKFQVYCLPGEKNCKAEGN